MSSARADGCDAGVVHADAAVHEGVADAAEQAGPVGGDQRQHRVPLRGVLGEVDGGRRAEMPKRARRATRGRRERRFRVLQLPAQALHDLAHARPAADRLAGVLEHREAVERVVAEAGDDARIEHVQVQRIERRGHTREQVLLVTGVDEYLGAAAPLVLAREHQHQRPAVVARFFSTARVCQAISSGA